ncbi:uncharacterized protein SPPG_02450 [Spizellomyces punctatus DAOM BR117]|uniref:t-SNARE coiled-coil homology domain-containing protein n=1 Tax=Spizellomyces punctatus (strain DAOM BR117) TaxID=645134 RepID=A0A0L0HLK8_SPIPD|nr:uncharacterized protein SPPG_02450 [Spizellomyces punctatus DAOM BR117]KND01943.1 hypothetical protein SPPG_02450 [Spizellomyces punctatus DAOM BR117]|eukprot:XP_016609982.1 hypothetical protein SPPG_02450 [Spizellomyces punctatus DAOM BR117]
MSELDDYDEEMQEVLEQIENVLGKELPRLKGQERMEKCSYLKNRLNRAKKLHRTLLVEIRELPPPTTTWDQKAKAYEQKIAQLTQDVQWAETTAQTDDLKQKKTIDDMSNKEITQTAIQIQEQTQQSTARTKRIVEETLEMGLAVKDEVLKQGNQMSKIQEDLATVESNLKRAEKQLRVFLRRMATDKIFIVFILLIVVLVVVAIVLYVLKTKGIIDIGKGGITLTGKSITGESAGATS